jgi:adenine/guanine phosphoribosyltransferase-like PRPP-binding protein
VVGWRGVPDAYRGLIKYENPQLALNWKAPPPSLHLMPSKMSIQTTNTHFTEPTTHYWQRIRSPSEISQLYPPFQYSCPVRLPNGQYLLLPIRRLPNNPKHAVASLLVNAASLDVVDTLSHLLSEQLKVYYVDVIVGLPTLGHALCPGVARGLGHSRYVPMGYSKKFWYDVELSTPVSSITSPEVGQKQLWLDPHALPLLRGCRVAIVDDAVSSGTTMLAAWKLLEGLGMDIVVAGVAMKQGGKWKDVLGVERAKKLVGVFDSPLLEAVPEGWSYRSETVS